MSKLFGKQWKALLISVCFVIAIIFSTSIGEKSVTVVIWLVLLQILYLIINFIYSLILLVKKVVDPKEHDLFKQLLSTIMSLVLLLVIGGLYLIVFAGVLVILLPFLA